MASQEQYDPRDIVTSELKQVAMSEATVDFWSQSAMESAQPIEIEVDVNKMAVEMLAEAEWQAEGDVVIQEPSYPEASMMAAAAWDPQPSCPPAGSNTQRVPNRGIIPYCAVGKLFMTFDGARFVGSAWTIASEGVFTAGHCVYDHDRGGWADNILFVPQFDDGASPVGQWTAIQIASLRGWTDSKDFKFDLATFKTDRPIQPVTGSLGWMANYPPNQGPYTGIGYPAAAPFDGKRMWRSTGNYRGGSNPIQAYNDMTAGCSGGPWSVWKGGTPYTNGLNSFRYTSDPASMYSPHFANGFLNLFNWVK